MIDKTSTNTRSYLFRYVISIYLGFEMGHKLNTKNQIYPIFPITTNDLTKAKSGKSDKSDGFPGVGGRGRGGGCLEG